MKSSLYPRHNKFYFKKFSRKTYAVFCSLRKVIHISNLTIVYTLIVAAGKLNAQSDTVAPMKLIDLEQVEVVSDQGSAVSEELSHFISVTALTDVECVPAQSITDLLRFAGNVDIRQRGKNGIQSDISIRGGSFDHSLVLLNGINISDPQTGHLSLNLPVETDAISRVEILNGPGTRIYGSNAFSGAVNFITLLSDTNSLQFASSFGEYGLFNSSATINLSLKHIKNLLHYNNAFSSGYTRNTDFRRQSIFYQGKVDYEKSSVGLQFGYSDRAFGANEFYTPRYPDQFEENQLYLMVFDFKSGSKLPFDSRIYWRRHVDRFELFREGDDWYRVEDSMTVSNNPEFTSFDTIPWYRHHNHHINDVFGVQTEISKRTSVGITRWGTHLRSENIISTNIGYDKGIVVPVSGYPGVYYTLSDNRTNFDSYIEQSVEFLPFYVTEALLLNWNSYLPNRISLFPGVDARCYLGKNTYLFESYNYSQGLPTFTDLTYEDPSNQGNNELKPYSQHSYNVGIYTFNRHFSSNLNYFYNRGHNVIDWVWYEQNSRFSPINTKKYISQGIEFTGQFHAETIPVLNLFLDQVRLSYTYIDMVKKTGSNISKYFNVRQKFSAMLQKEFFSLFTVAWDVSYTEREGHYVLYDFENLVYTTLRFHPYWLNDLRISFNIKSFTLYTEATNLFDIHYIDVGSINQPGRWIAAGIKYKFSGF